MENLRFRIRPKAVWTMLPTRLLLAAVLLWACVGSEHLNAQQFAQPGNFDFYVFTLSWSPQFCASTQNIIASDAIAYGYVRNHFLNAFESGRIDWMALLGLSTPRRSQLSLVDRRAENLILRAVS